MSKKLPKQILVYVSDHVDDQPVYAVANGVEEIPEDVDGEEVGVYALTHVRQFRMVRELK